MQLTRFWLTSLTEYKSIGAQTEDNRPWDSSVRGEVRTYAGGRQRAVGSLGASETWRVTLVELPYEDVVLLRTWMNQGITVFARDHRGQAMYCTFFSVPVEEHKSQTWQAARYKVALELHRVDVVEGV